MASVQAPSKSEILKYVARSWKGILRPNAGFKPTSQNWYCKITVMSEKEIEVHWADSNTIQRGQMGPAGGREGNPIAINLRGFKDGSVVRLQWNTIDKVFAEWWPSAQAQAGQRRHKPAFMQGDLELL